MSTPATADAPVQETPGTLDTEGFIESIDAAFEGITPFEEAVIDDVVPDLEKEPAKDKKDTTTTDEVDPLDEVDVKDWTPEAARRFKELKNQLNEERKAARDLRETVTQREARLAELEAKATDPEIETLRQKIEEYESKLLVTKLEDTTAYKDLVEAPLKAVVSESDALANKYNIDPDELFDALALTDEEQQSERVSELLATATERDRFKAYQLIEKLKPIHAQRDALQNNSQEALREAQELEAVRSQEALRQRAEQRKVAATQVAERIASKLTFLKNIEGVDMDAVAKEAAAVDHTTISPVNAAYNQMTASLFPKVDKELLRVTKENDALVAKLASYAKAEPRVGGSGGVTGGSTAGAEVSFVDAINRQFGG